MKSCLLVRAYSANLFGYCDVTLGPVCVAVCIAAIAVGNYAHCVSLICRNALHQLTRLTTIHVHLLPTLYLSIRLFLAILSRARTHARTLSHIFLNLWK
jgi:hypothetical protein